MNICGTGRLRRLGAFGILLGSAVCGLAQTVVPRISFDEAVRRAKSNEITFASASAAAASTRIDASLARTALLPSATYHNQVLYTQPNGQTNQGGQTGVQASPIFIANNAVHEYVSQASINETIGLKSYTDAQVASANASKAVAELEIARRGLISTVVTLYYTVAASDKKLSLLQEALREAQEFTKLTQEREVAREVAHADVVKALLQQQGKQRDLLDALVAAQKARLELGVLLFPDPRTDYTIDSSSATAPLPTQAEVTRLASDHNPEIRSALAGMRAADLGVTSAKAAYLPDVALNFSYGIDAPQFATRGPENVRNLGYSVSGTLDIPVWDWFATQKRIKQSQIQRDAAKITLTAAQRRLIANLEEAYAEASAAKAQLDLLERSAQTAQESLRLTKLRYSAGESTALEVVDAQNAFLSAQTALSDGFIRYEAALAALQVLTGTI